MTREEQIALDEYSRWRDAELPKSGDEAKDSFLEALHMGAMGAAANIFAKIALLDRVKDGRKEGV